MGRKWTLWVGLIVIVIAFILVWQFAPDIQRWMANTFIKILVLLLTFAAGWLLGRYGGKKPDEKQKNAKNITEAQK